MTTYTALREALERLEGFRGDLESASFQDAVLSASSCSVGFAPSLLADNDRQAAEIARLSAMLDHQRDEAIEADRMYSAEIARLREALKDAAHAMGLITRHAICQDVHHANVDRHEFHEPCPVAARFVAAYDAARAALEQA